MVVAKPVGEQLQFERTAADLFKPSCDPKRAHTFLHVTPTPASKLYTFLKPATLNRAHRTRHEWYSKIHLNLFSTQSLASFDLLTTFLTHTHARSFISSTQRSGARNCLFDVDDTISFDVFKKERRTTKEASTPGAPSQGGRTARFR